jgi:trk system potassium uptake protein TrkA
MYSMLVIGLGRFGSNLALKLSELGNEVMAVDLDEQRVNKIAPMVTSARVGDCMDISVLQTIGAKNFDVCFVCISNNFQSSLEITSLLKEAGAPVVVSKADRELHAKFLLKVGADDIVYPERDMAQRTAVRYSSNKTMDYIELAADYAIFEFCVPSKWAGKSLRQLDVRGKYHINVIARKFGQRIIPLFDADTVLEPGEHLLAAGSRDDMAKIVEKKI